MVIKNKLLLVLILVHTFGFSEKLAGQADTAVLAYQQFIQNILQHHPIARQADLRMTEAAGVLLGARGGFDPYLYGSWEEKNFDDKLYYRHLYGEVRVPTLLGIDVVGGYENTEGEFLNPEENTSNRGLWNIGVEVNLLQGLWINERRTALQQAQVFQDIARNEQQIILNDLLFDASAAYVDWQKYVFFQQVYEENQTLARIYFENTRQSFFGGEKTAMDTLEATILWQDAKVLLQSNLAKLTKARQNLENFLWYNEEPVLLRPEVIPQVITTPIIEPEMVAPVEQLVSSHPEILQKINKRRSLEIEQRLKREKLKPKLKAKFNPLLGTTDESIAPVYTTSDYKWGVDFSMPLFLREARSGIALGEVKLQDVAIELANKQNELTNKLENSRQQQMILQQQVNQQTINVDGYRQLLEGENEKFLFGESSVFLLNKRQEKYINGRLKLIDLYAKLQLERMKYLYYANRLI